jgi:hypothetical protein
MFSPTGEKIPLSAGGSINYSTETRHRVRNYKANTYQDEEKREEEEVYMRVKKGCIYVLRTAWYCKRAKVKQT